jgi:hypothetical protein
VSCCSRRAAKRREEIAALLLVALIGAVNPKLLARKSVNPAATGGSAQFAVAARAALCFLARKYSGFIGRERC